jgi:dephospho-CoA kinase
MLRVGLTGGIGSGKSCVAQWFQRLGVDIIDADKIAHLITEPNTYSFETIIEHFGNCIVDKNGNLDRSALRQRVFQSPDERRWLENLLHPIIRESIKSRINKVNSPYCVIVIPLLAESNNIDYLDRICVISTTEALQIKRVTQRDNISASDASKILAAQASNQARLKIADDVIENNADIDSLRTQVAHLNQKYLDLCR